MEIIKYQGNEVLAHIRHNLREIPNEKKPSNESINPALTKNNYSFVDRGKNAAEVNGYRKALEKEIFQYNRKNLVHAVEVVIQCPDDCPPEQHEAFFEESFRYISSTLPMGERCIFSAVVHRDEKHYAPDGTMISKDHLHIMYVPAVQDKKHEGYDYKLCADQLTKRANLKALHPGLQKHLDQAGIKATVYRKKEGSGKTIALSVAQLKEITAKTGIRIDHTLTVDELAEILNKNILQEKQIKTLRKNINEQINEQTKHLTNTIKNLQKEVALKTEALTKEKQRSAALEQKLHELEKTHQKERTWGRSSGWGTQTKPHTWNKEEDINE